LKFSTSIMKARFSELKLSLRKSLKIRTKSGSAI